MQQGFGDEFVFTGWSFDAVSGELELTYSSSEMGDFIEVFQFPDVDTKRYQQLQPSINSAINCLYWMAGVSYYKTSLATQINFHSGNTAVLPNQLQAEWLTETWQHGLAELAFNNQLPWLDHIKFTPATEPATATAAIDLGLLPKSLVAIGGGKDSLVSIEAIKSMGEDASLFVVGQSVFIQSVADQTGLPLLRVNRLVDDRLKKVNQEGAFNGHVPITAINSCVAVVAALLYDFDSIVFSNERSADSGNLTMENGQWVNHQYSKSLVYERSWQQIIAQYIASDLHCFSLLRPFSELSVVRRFSSLKHYFAYFSSCNRNFHLAGSQNAPQQHWCGRCPKCAFVFLCLAPYISKATLLAIFDKDLLSDSELLPLFEALLGIQGDKPFECVGEQQECRAALQLLAEHSEWQGHDQMNRWLSLLPIMEQSEIDEILAPSDMHMIPAKRHFMQVLTDED